MSLLYKAWQMKKGFLVVARSDFRHFDKDVGANSHIDHHTVLKDEIY